MEPVTLGGRFDFDALRIVNRDSDGSVVSSQFEAFFDYSSALLNRIPTDWPKYLPSGTPADLQTWLDGMTRMLDQVQSLAPRPIGERAGALTSWASEAQQMMTRQINSLQQLVTLMLIADSQTTARDRLERELAGLTRLAGEQVDKAHDAAEKVTALLESTQAAAALTAATGRARIFAAEADEQDTRAALWLGFASLMLVVLVVLAFLFAGGRLIQRPAETDTFALANYVLAKVLILGAVMFALTFATRQYGTHRHNATMNRHRSHALRTYRAIVQASRGEDTHDLILKEAADAIFAPHDSGYIKSGGTSDGAGIVQVVQGLLRSPATPSS